MKATSSISSISTVILILGEGIEIRLELIVLIASTKLKVSDWDKTLKWSYPALEIFWSRFQI